MLTLLWCHFRLLWRHGRGHWGVPWDTMVMSLCFTSSENGTVFVGFVSEVKDSVIRLGQKKIEGCWFPYSSRWCLGAHDPISLGCGSVSTFPNQTPEPNNISCSPDECCSVIIFGDQSASNEGEGCRHMLVRRVQTVRNQSSYKQTRRSRLLMGTQRDLRAAANRMKLSHRRNAKGMKLIRFC